MMKFRALEAAGRQADRELTVLRTVVERKMAAQMQNNITMKKEQRTKPNNGLKKPALA